MQLLLQLLPRAAADSLVSPKEVRLRSPSKWGPGETICIQLRPEKSQCLAGVELETMNVRPSYITWPGLAESPVHIQVPPAATGASSLANMQRQSTITVHCRNKHDANGVKLPISISSAGTKQLQHASMSISRRVKRRRWPYSAPKQTTQRRQARPLNLPGSMTANNSLEAAAAPL